ncbi:hypothetical protein [Pseudomonas alabamensis]|uniref:hypothetical protein n=1 Tax=Pseudomonas alabamensis TaxID=3064349 RepID=UPI000745CA2C|nr:hypothetical protein APT63_09395 [Pseudomonas monteilii]
MSKDEQFINAISSELFGEHFRQYKDWLTKPADNDIDPYGLARNAMASLSDAQKMDIINFMKVVMADTASSIFGAFDGVHFPNDLDGDFVLFLDGEEIQGDLQSLFIDKAQQEGAYG